MAERDPLQAYIEDGLERLKDRYPDVHSKLELAIAQLSEASRPEDFQAIGVICRDAIILFAGAIFSPDFVKPGDAVPTDEQTQNRIEMTLAHFGQLGGSERLRRLLRAVSDYAQGLQHNRESDRAEAQRTALFSTLSLAELATLMETATRNEYWVQQYGVYKCPVCGSTGLDEDELVDYDADFGPVLLARYLACGECPWTSLGGRP